jgi:hypothetical protein
LKKALTIGLVAAALAATLTFVAASSKTGAQSTALPDAPKAAQTAPQKAPYAVMAQNTVSVLNYDRGPRIIIVPQAGDRDERANSRASTNSGRYNVDDEEIAPRRQITAPPPRTTPRWMPRAEPQHIEKPYVATPSRRVETPARPRMETRTVRHIDMSKPKAEPKIEAPPIPQPPSPRRAVLSAPPPPAEGPTPIRPTPRFDSGLGSKAEAPANPVEPAADLTNDSPPPADITADQPPPGYTPPAAMRGEKPGDKY